MPGLSARNRKRSFFLLWQGYPLIRGFRMSGIRNFSRQKPALWVVEEWTDLGWDALRLSRFVYLFTVMLSAIFPYSSREMIRLSINWCVSW